jgi:predicted RNA-binding Zn-ribbon protein involved in translation (DUF1610 family)
MASRSDWFERHPYSTLALSLVWYAAWVVADVAMIRQGHFRWGRGADAELITVAARPGFFWTVIVTWFFFPLVAPMLAALRVYHFRHRRHLRDRLEAGRCHACGYDLAGNVSGICPECGMTIARRTARGPRFISHRPL